MNTHSFRSFLVSLARSRPRVAVLRLASVSLCAATSLLLATSIADRIPVRAQQSTPQAPPATEPAAQAPDSAAPQQPAQPSPTATPQDQATQAPPSQPDSQPPSSQNQTAAPPSASSSSQEPGSITEDELRKELVGKDLFLRGGYLDNSLTFNEHGAFIGHSPQGSYTLSGIRITHVRIMKHKVELTGDRYGLHFLGSLAYEDPTKAVDRVNITPKKKEVRITIDRELVIKPKKEKEKGKGKGVQPAAKPAPAATATNTPVASAPAPATPAPATTAAAPGAEEAPEASDVQEAQAEMAKAPEAERPADSKSVTTTLSPAHANKVLEEALGNIFAQGFDTRMMNTMPGYWKLYYEAVDAKADYRPKDASVLRQNMVDKKARLITTFEPASNQFAQDYGVAGMSEYHVVVSADGKPGEIAVARPIGFGLDESAVEAIRKATFEPALKDGKPVPVMLDMVFQFRIYSKRTDVASKTATPDPASDTHQLPGPYSVQH
jgi:TonB family protein